MLYTCPLLQNSQIAIWLLSELDRRSGLRWLLLVVLLASFLEQARAELCSCERELHSSAASAAAAVTSSEIGLPACGERGECSKTTILMSPLLEL